MGLLSALGRMGGRAVGAAEQRIGRGMAGMGGTLGDVGSYMAESGAGRLARNSVDPVQVEEIAREIFMRSGGRPGVTESMVFQLATQDPALAQQVRLLLMSKAPY